MRNYININCKYETGLRRGYVKQADRTKESVIMPIPVDLSQYRGSLRWALTRLRANGATHYTVSDNQYIRDNRVTQYCWTTYHGYKEQ